MIAMSADAISSTLLSGLIMLRNDSMSFDSVTSSIDINGSITTSAASSTTPAPGEEDMTILDTWLSLLLGMGFWVMVIIICFICVRQSWQAISQTYQGDSTCCGRCRHFWSCRWVCHVCDRDSGPSDTENGVTAEGDADTAFHEDPPPYNVALDMPRLDSSTILGDPPPAYNDRFRQGSAVSIHGNGNVTCYINLSFNHDALEEECLPGEERAGGEHSEDSGDGETRAEWEHDGDTAGDPSSERIPRVRFAMSLDGETSDDAAEVGQDSQRESGHDREESTGDGTDSSPHPVEASPPAQPSTVVPTPPRASQRGASHNPRPLHWHRTSHSIVSLPSYDEALAILRRDKSRSDSQGDSERTNVEPAGRDSTDFTDLSTAPLRRSSSLQSSIDTPM